MKYKIACIVISISLFNLVRCMEKPLEQRVAELERTCNNLLEVVNNQNEAIKFLTTPSSQELERKQELSLRTLDALTLANESTNDLESSQQCLPVAQKKDQQATQNEIIVQLIMYHHKLISMLKKIALISTDTEAESYSSETIRKLNKYHGKSRVALRQFFNNE